MSHGYRQILERADQHFAAVTDAQPASLSCRRGCAICCHGFFEIGAADVALIADGLAGLPPGERNTLISRAEEAMLKADHPDLRGGPTADKELFFNRTDSLPCPALGPEGDCRIYAHRPLVCRTFGIPLREGDRYLGQECHLNFVGVSLADKERVAWDLLWEDELGPEDEFTVAEAIVLAGRTMVRGRR